MTTELESAVSSSTAPASRCFEGDAVEAGVYVDVSKRFALVCRAVGVRARIVFSLGCWDACVVASTKANPYWTESNRLRFVLEQFLDACPWPKIGEATSFELRVAGSNSVSEERIVWVKLGLWDGAENDPFLLFVNDGES